MRDPQYIHIPLTATGHPEGCALRYHGEVVAVFDSAMAILGAFRAGKEALPMLAACLAKTRSRI